MCRLVKFTGRGSSRRRGSAVLEPGPCLPCSNIVFYPTRRRALVMLLLWIAVPLSSICGVRDDDLGRHWLHSKAGLLLCIS